MKLFKTTDFAFHKVNVVFWQTDENDKPAVVTEPYEKAFTAANIRKEQEFYASELEFRLRLEAPKQAASPQGATGGRNENPREVRFTLGPDGNFQRTLEEAAKNAFKHEIAALTKNLKDPSDEKKSVKRFLDSLETEVEWTHRLYVKDDEYIPYGEDIESFLRREIGKPIIRWVDSPQLGYEILPNKYFYRYQPPRPAKELLDEFWSLEKEAEKLLKGLAL